MNTQRFNRFTVLLAVIIMGLLIAGCGRFNLDVQDGGMTIKAELDENEINQVLRNERSHSEDDILDEVTGVDIQPDLVRVFGRVRTPEDGWQDGSYDLALSALSGQLVAEIVAVDVPGVELNDPRIQKLNEHLAKELAEMTTADHGSVKFKDVTLSEDTARFVVRVRWDEAQ